MEGSAPGGDAGPREAAPLRLNNDRGVESSRPESPMAGLPPRLGDLSVKAVSVDGTMTGSALEAVFQADNTLMAVLISDPAEPIRVGLITRLTFFEAMTGRLGFGRHLQALRRLGVGISVDDFGTGYSSLSYLAEIPLDSLKIDKSFVADLESRQTSRTLARTVINLAHELGVRSVAEGVENERQFTILQEMGCEVIQGYLVGRPEAPEVTAETWLSGQLRGPGHH